MAKGSGSTKASSPRSNNVTNSSDSKMEKLGFKKFQDTGEYDTEGYFNKGSNEIWFERTYKGKLVRVLQEEVGNNNWFNVKVGSNYLENADGNPMSFRSPDAAAKEAIDEINKKRK